MENNNNKRRKVVRQSWKPGFVASVFGGAWTVVYSALKVAIAAVVTVLAIVAVCLVCFVGILGDYLEEEILPQAGVQLEGFDLEQPTYIYYLDEQDNIQVLQKLFADTDSEWAEYEKIPEAMIYAAVSIEDHRFFEHQGVDWFTTIKACINMFVGSGDQFGGSSITQQLIKNMLLKEDDNADDVTVQRKVLEIFRATEFEKRYDKATVLEWYLNYIYLGNRCTGVKAAAEKYFGKELEDLTPAECACIISITNNPSIYNPISDKEVTFKGETRTRAEWNKIRRDNVLWTMRNYGYLTEEEYQAALIDSENLVFKSGIEFENKYSDCSECGYRAHNSSFLLEGKVYYCPECGAATTIGENASQQVYSWFVDTVINDLAKEMALQDGHEITDKVMDYYRSLICRSGYHIYSTLDLNVQNSLDAVYTNLDEIPTTASLQQLQSGMCIIDNETGDIVAISGGVGEKTVFYAYNRATVNTLQPGSSLKPLTVYAPAFELGIINPATVIKDLPLYYYDKESGSIIDMYEEEELDPDMKLSSYPKNDDFNYNYSYTILRGIMSSVNAVAVNTLDTLGLEYSFNFAKEKFHLDSLVRHYVHPTYGTTMTDLAYSPLGLGAPTIGISVRDMSEAYAALANNGVWREGRTYTHVYNTDGELVMYNEQESEKILSEKTINYINYCLDSAVAAGTGTAADIKGQNVAGKTGSTSSWRDRWFCGFTSYYTAAVWCGYDVPEVITLTGSVRSNPACRLFKKVLEPVHQGLEAVPLYDDSEFVYVSICQDSGLLATDACTQDCRGSRVVKAQAYAQDLPTATCDRHVAVDFCKECKAPANEFCRHFAQVGKATLEQKVLCRMTQKEVDAVVLACEYGLDDKYLTNDYIYLINEDGTDGTFFGIDGKANEGLNYPFVVGNAHTQQMWEKYLKDHPDTQLPEETQPNAGPEIVVPDEKPGDNLNMNDR